MGIIQVIIHFKLEINQLLIFLKKVEIKVMRKKEKY